MGQTIRYQLPKWRALNTKNLFIKGHWIFKQQVDTQHIPYASFENGITRTIWLLSHGAESFPVECPEDCAIDLFRLAGLADSECLSVEKLIPAQYTQRIWMTSEPDADVDELSLT